MSSRAASRPPKTHYDSPSSSSSYSASDSDVSASSVRHSMDNHQRPVAGVAILRCLRCAREVEATTTDDASDTGMVRIGHNIYYCQRCAKMVGYK